MEPLGLDALPQASQAQDPVVFHEKTESISGVASSRVTMRSASSTGTARAEARPIRRSCNTSAPPRHTDHSSGETSAPSHRASRPPPPSLKSVAAAMHTVLRTASVSPPVESSPVSEWPSLKAHTNRTDDVLSIPPQFFPCRFGILVYNLVGNKLRKGAI